MIIYLVGMEVHNIEFCITNPPTNVLLSYYDITDGPLPFRKKSWELIKQRGRKGKAGK